MLLLIDYQAEFINQQADWYPKMLANVRQEIAQAKARNKPIISLLYSGFGPLLPDLADLLEGYEDHHEVIKGNDDGHVEVLGFLDCYFPISDTLRAGHDELRIMGGNLSACVKRTVLPLANAISLQRCWRCSLDLNISASYDSTWWGRDNGLVTRLWEDFQDAGIRLHDPDLLWSPDERLLA